MNLPYSVMFLIVLMVTLSFNFVFPIQIDDSKSLKLSDKYASPQLYVFGGFGHEKRLSSGSQFNSSTGRWDSINDMSVGKNHLCGAVVGRKIYLFGGYSDRPLKTAEVYDCESGTYSEFRALSNSDARYGCGAAVLEGFIYIAGGGDGFKKLASVVRYNIQTSRRENVSPMLIVREGLQLVELSGRLYAIGGISQEHATNTVETYNPSTSQWSEAASTQYAHYFFGAAVHEGKIYVRSYAGFEVYSPEINQWKALTQLNDFVGSSLVSMNGRLWAVGGGHTDNIGSKSVSVYNTSTNTWNNQLDMDAERMYFTAFVVNH